MCCSKMHEEPHKSYKCCTMRMELLRSDVITALCKPWDSNCMTMLLLLNRIFEQLLFIYTICKNTHNRLTCLLIRSSMRRGSGPSTSGVYSHSETDSYTGSELDDAWSQQLEEISGRLNSENDRTGFLRMVNRNHVFNSSNYSLSSLFR